jgi:uncharacterized protein with GYD domain
MREHTGRQVWLAVVAAMAAIAGAHSATRSLQGLIDAVVRNGPDSQLPAHLSVVLGVSQVERATAVKQAVIRDGDTVRTFNVCAANHDVVVMMTHDEHSQSTKAYLTSAAGKLRKAVLYQAGSAAHERSLEDARGDYSAELALWTAFAEKAAKTR